MEPSSTIRRVLVTGASGLVGQALCRQLRQCGIEVVELRHRAGKNALAWDGEKGAPPPPEALRDINAVVHLAGAPVARRWTKSAKRAIRDSRVNGTRALAESLAALPRESRPEVLICMSGTGIYGRRRPEALLDEKASLAPAGESFLADVARAWEAAAAPAAEAGIRTVHLRAGMVLAREGGAIPAMVRPYKIFLGGPTGEGKQRIPWISLQDLTSLIFFCLRNENIRGPVNAVAPHTITNADFARQLGSALKRPALVRTPRWALRLAMGRMADELIFADLSPFPAKIMEAGFQFAHYRVNDALHSLFGEPPIRAR